LCDKKSRRKRLIKILITTSSFGEYSKIPMNKMKEHGVKIITNPFRRKLSVEESFQLYAEDIDGVIAGTEKITGLILEQAKNLKVVSRCGAGVDNVDLEAVKKRGISLYSTPDAPTLAVAELCVALILNLLRKITEMDSAIKNGKWNKLMGNLLFKKKVGIIGFGRIGQKVAELLAAFGVELAYYDIETKTCLVKCVQKKIEEILKWADIITLHLAPSREEKAILNDKELRSMKKGSWLVNASRGGVVDEKVLYECLKDGHIAGAAIDVFEQEPYNGLLKELDNVILTPHIGSYAIETRIKMEIEAVDNLIKGLNERGLM
jgi:D-3-phosphoglycerate dehydrogenase / 2-oxoglutarate reductase